MTKGCEVRKGQSIDTETALLRVHTTQKRQLGWAHRVHAVFDFLTWLAQWVQGEIDSGGVKLQFDRSCEPLGRRLCLHSLHRRDVLQLDWC